MNEPMYFLLWALQSARLWRDERLAKAVLSFKLLLHYFHLSFLPYSEGVSRRFQAEITQVVTLQETLGRSEFSIQRCF
jgi:hypothetical protein